MSLKELHERLVAGDEAAGECVAQILLRELQPLLRRRFRAVSPDLLATAAVDAILEYLHNPKRFDSTRCIPLIQFVKYVASRNLLNLLRAEERRRIRETEYWRRVSTTDDSDIDGVNDGITRCCEVLLEATPSSERRALTLWLNGERRTDPIALALGCGSLERSARAQEVKRFKDRTRNRARKLAITRLGHHEFITNRMDQVASSALARNR